MRFAAWIIDGCCFYYCCCAGLTLYKVQQNIYLLDFQRKEGDQFTFMSLCALIITQLKVLSAASKAMQIGLPGQSPQVHYCACTHTVHMHQCRQVLLCKRLYCAHSLVCC